MHCLTKSANRKQEKKFNLLRHPAGILAVTLLSIASAGLICASPASAASELETIFTFGGSLDSPTGINPHASLLMYKGDLYGTTIYGGDGTTIDGEKSISGIIFKLSPPKNKTGAWVENRLYSFPDIYSEDAAGGRPQSNLIMDESGALYGTTTGGGYTNYNIAGSGYIFRITPPDNGKTSWTETVLYRFTGGPDGSNPYAGLVMDKSGTLYGTTADGGRKAGCINNNHDFGCGVVFKLDPPATGKTAWKETTLHAFANGADGATPQAGVVLGPGGSLFGTTSGSSNSLGTVFRLSPPKTGGSTWTETVLHAFTGGVDGDTPVARLIFGNGGVLYGTTSEPNGSPPEQGTAFKLSPPIKVGEGWVETILHHFTGGKDGGQPSAELTIDKSGNLYGTTAGGGTGDLCNEQSECGVVFELSPPKAGSKTWSETVLATFNKKNGTFPEAGLIFDGAESLYGTTEDGGSMGGGTVFKLTK